MQNAETFRLFVAIPLPEEVKDAIGKAQMELRQAMPGEAVRWTKREQFHLTLKFLGKVEARRLEALTGALRHTCEKFAPLQLRARRIGFFPDLRSPRVVWAGVDDERKVLPELQKSIETAMTPFTAEKPEGSFTGHVTIGRARKLSRAEVAQLTRLALEAAERHFGDWTAEAVELIRSELAAAGPCYTTLVVIPLANQLNTERLAK